MNRYELPERTLIDMHQTTEDTYGYYSYFYQETTGGQAINMFFSGDIDKNAGYLRLVKSGYDAYITRSHIEYQQAIYSAYIFEDMANGSTEIGVVKYKIPCSSYDQESFKLMPYITKATPREDAFALAKYDTNGGMLVFRDETLDGNRLAFFEFFLDTGSYYQSAGMNVDYYPSSLAAHDSYLALLAHKDTEVLYLIINHSTLQTV